MSEPKALTARLLARLAEISALEPTVDVAKRDSYVEANGWHVDAREIALPSEAPGAPEPEGAFAVASRVLLEYGFTPQRLIRGTFDPQAPLALRPMLLTATYLWMTFELAVRVTRVIDERRVGAHGEEQVWGYSYQTLAGHLERGEITFELTKHIASGQVVFRIHSYSQTGHVPNLLHRIGFRLVGRRLQKRFAEESLQNMRRLVLQTTHGRVAP
mgnify:CR=1 FL=1